MRRGAMAATRVIATLLIVSHAHAMPAPRPIFKHIVIVFQENRTPDNLFGSNPAFEPGVDIASSGVNSKGQTIKLTAEPLSDCYDIGHTHADFELSLQGADLDPVYLSKQQRPGVACAAPPNPQFKYADNSTGTMQPYFDIATNYGFANRMFQTNQGPSFPAHQFIFGGTSAPRTSSSLFAAENLNVPRPGLPAGCIAAAITTVNLIDGFGSQTSHRPTYPCYDHPTLTDLLERATPPISWRYYAASAGSIWTAPNAIKHICQPDLFHIECTGPDWTNGNVVPNNPAQVLTDIGNCNLPSVSWVIPNGKESDHPGGNRGLGPQWVASIVNAVGSQPKCVSGETYWNDTAVIITWDDWGGWYDHVPPFAINRRTHGSSAWGDGYTYGFRVPLLVVSAYTQAGYVSNGILDFGSILYFIEQNFGLGFIGPGRGTYSNYADFHSRYRGHISEFFGRSSPRPFVAIPARMAARDFINAPASNDPPDDD